MGNTSPHYLLYVGLLFCSVCNILYIVVTKSSQVKTDLNKMRENVVECIPS